MHNLLHDEKDIDSIFFYAINESKNYLGFFYTANNIKYKKDYKDIDFKDSVDRLIKVYNTLKNEKNIKLIGDLTKDIIEGKIVLNNNMIHNKTLINTTNYDYLSMFSYIKLIIEHSLASLDLDTELNYHDHKFQYLNFNQTNPLIKPNLSNIVTIPITFYKNNNGYKLKYKILKETQEYLFDTDIKIFNKSIIVNINNNEYKGEIIFDKLNIDNTIRLKKEDTTIYSNHYDNNLTDMDIKYISKVFEMLDISYEINGIKTTGLNYILYNNKENYEYYMHLNIQGNLIRINLKQLKKYKKDNIDFKVEEENYDYLITKLNDKYILIQQKYLMSNNSNYEYKQNINKSRYYILQTDEYITNIIDSNIVKKVSVDYKVDNIDDIKKLTYKKD